MKLQNWMDENGLDDEALALRVGRHRTQILRVRTGRSRPSDDLKRAIADASEGRVQPNDWFDGLPDSYPIEPESEAA